MTRSENRTDAATVGNSAAEARPYANALARLKSARLRPTRQRLALAKLLFDEGDCHITAEQLHAMARNASVKVSLATVYNTLNQFEESGLLREVAVGPGRSYYDTNTHDHQHFYVEPEGELIDIPVDSVALAALPVPPEGTVVDGVDVIIRLRKA